MSEMFSEPNLLDGKLYLCIECLECKKLLPVALAFDDYPKSLNGNDMNLKYTCNKCSRTHKYRLGHVQYARANNSHLQLL